MVRQQREYDEFQIAARGEGNSHAFVGLGLEFWIKNRKILHTCSNSNGQGLGLELRIIICPNASVTISFISGQIAW